MQIKDYNPTFNSGSMKGTFTAVFPDGMKIHFMKYFEKAGNRWVGYPSKCVDSATKKWVEYVEFPAELKKRYENEMLALLKQKAAASDDGLPELPKKSWDDDEVSF